MKKIKILQKLNVNGQLYEIGTLFDFDKAFFKWIQDNKINYCLVPVK